MKDQTQYFREETLQNLASADVQSISSLALASAVPIKVDPAATSVTHVLVPEGYTLDRVDLERLAPRPRRPFGETTLRDPASFTAYVTRYADDDTVVFADVSRSQVTAIFNHHATARDPGWGDWRAKLELKTTPEWDAWMEFASRAQSQERFAYFVEQHLGQIVEPDAADLLGIARNLKVTKDVVYEKAIHQQSGGVELRYKEDVASSSRVGSMEVPERLVLSLTPYQGGVAERVNPWLRYRVADGQCHFVVDFGEEAKRLLESLFDAYVYSIAEELNGTSLFFGTAPEAVTPRQP